MSILRESVIRRKASRQINWKNSTKNETVFGLRTQLGVTGFS